MFPFLPAHGALGPWDEVIFIGVAAVFLVMMGVSWVRSRNTPIEDDIDDEAAHVPAEVDDEDRAPRFTLD
jgi:hypothetical protein